MTSEQTISATNSGSDKEQILQDLINTLQELSGLGAEDIDAEATFLQMGFDSLFLTQAALAFKKNTGVDIAFRQLLSDAPTLSSLAEYIVERMPDAEPETAVQVEVPKAPVVQPERPVQVAEFPPPGNNGVVAQSEQQVLSPPVTPTGGGVAQSHQSFAALPTHSTGSSSGASQSTLGRVLSEQLAIMARQLEVLRGIPDTSTHSPQAQALTTSDAPVAGSVPIDQVHTPAMQPAPHSRNGDIESIAAVKIGNSEPERHAGPWKPADISPTSDMTPKQASALKELVGRVTTKTAKSKKWTEVNRSHFADARAVAGFRLEWKEMVYPVVSERSKGSAIWDIDGNKYVDLTMGFGSVLFGHSPEFITDALRRQLDLGVEIGPQSELAGQVARDACEMAGVDRVAFCNTGSEAVLVAMRLARTVTGRDKVVVFAGDYHGIFDEVLVRPGAQGNAMPVAPGIPASSLDNVLVLDRHDPEVLKKISENASEICAVLIEPVQSRNPDDQSLELLRGLRTVTEELDMALIFDEIITGFRLDPKGVRGALGVDADIVTYGKVLGGGMPIGIVGGKRKYLDALDGGQWQYGDDSFPETGMTFFAGTFVRHPMAMAAATAVLAELKRRGPEFQKSLNSRAEDLRQQLNAVFLENEAPVHLQRFGSQFQLKFTVQNRFNSLLYFFLREKGVHVWEGRPIFISDAHTSSDIAEILAAFESGVIEMYAGGFWPAEPSPDSGGSEPALESVIEISPTEPPDFIDAANLPVVSRFPLTESQEEIWLASRLSAESSRSFDENLVLRLKGELDVGAIRSAVQAVVDRHDALRTVFDEDGQFQTVNESLLLEIPYVDLSDLRLPLAEQRAAELLAKRLSPAINLNAGPIVHCQIIRLADDLHLLELGTHHIVFDGWSYHVFLLDLAELYSASIERRKAVLQKPVQLSQYATWLKNYEMSEAGKQTESYWHSRFAKPLPTLMLPSDRARPQIQTYNGAMKRKNVDAALIERVKVVGARCGSTAFSTFLAAYCLLLHKLTDEEDIAVGIAMAGQSMASIEKMIGHCVNFLPIRSDIDPDSSFTDYMRQVTSELLDAHDHQGYTMNRLTKQLSGIRQNHFRPLVSAIFNIDRNLSGVEFGNLEHELLPDIGRYFNFELFFDLVESVDGLELVCKYNTDLFDAATIERWMGSYHQLLEQIADDPDRPISDFSCVTAPERDLVFGEWNDTRTDYPRRSSVHELFEQQAVGEPDATAVVDSAGSMSYKQLDQETNRLARWLISHGCAPGDRVGLLMGRGRDAVVSMLAVLKAGCSYVPLDTDQPSARWRRMLREANVKLVLSADSVDQALAVDRATLICLSDIESEIGGHSDQSLGIVSDPLDPAYVMFTSGSTGVTKGIVIPHTAIVRLVKNTDYIHLDNTDVVAHASNTSFDAATFEIWGALLNGATLVIIHSAELLSLTQLAKQLRHRGVTTLFLTTALFNLVAGVAPNSFATLKNLLFGGERVDPAAVRAIIQGGRPERLIHVYGPTETTTFATWHLIEEVAEDATTIPIGRPIANGTAYVVDGRNNLVPTGVVGELCLGGDGLAIGYLDDAEYTATRFIADQFSSIPESRLYLTGDLVRRTADGVIDYVGRLDNQVKVRGFRIEPGEIESALMNHALVTACVVTVHETKSGEKQLVAYLETATPVPTRENLLEHLRGLLPEYMLPSHIELLDRLPINANGKIDRAALPEIVPTEKRRITRVARPSNSLIEKLTRIWEDVLNRRGIDISENFFDLGGHSLIAARMFFRIEQELGATLPLSELFASPTIEQLSVAIAGNEPDWRIEPVVPQMELATINPDGTRPIIFIAGTLDASYYNLAKALGVDQPLTGIAPSVSGIQSRWTDSIEEKSAKFIEAMRKIQPDGAYHIFGHSGDGLAAFEVARQLKLNGDAIGLLAMSEAPDPGWERSSGNQRRNFNLQWRTIRQLRLRRMMAALSSRLKGRATATGVTGASLIRRWAGHQKSDALVRKEWLESIAKAVREYQPNPFDGSGVMFVTSKENGEPASAEYLNFWRSIITQNLEVVYLPGRHHTIMVEPNIRVLADCLKNCMRRTISSVQERQLA